MPNASRAHKLRHGLAVIAFAFSLPALADAGKAAAFYEDGLARFEKGDTAGAVIQLKNALQQNNKLLSAHVLLGRALLKQTELPAAEAAFNEALKLGVSPSVIAVPRGQLLMTLGRSKDLLRDVHPDGLDPVAQAEVLSMRGLALVDQGDVKAGRKSLQAAIDVDPSAVSPYLFMVPFLLQQGERDAARDAVGRAMALAPNNARVWNLEASFKHTLGDVQGALAGYDKALSLDETLEDARVARAALLVDLKRDDAALRDLDYLAAHVKQEPRSAYLRAVLSARRGNSEAVRNALTEVTDMVDAFPVEYVNTREQMLMLAALSHHGLGARENAKSYLDRLVSRFPKNIGARKLLGSIYLSEGDTARTLTTVEAVLRMAPDDPQALLLVGRAHLADKQFLRATRYLEHAADVLKDDPQALAALGFSQLGSGDTGAGVESLERAFASTPENASIAMVLANYYARVGAVEKSIAIATTLVESAGRLPVALNLLGSVQMAAGRSEAARDAYTEAIAKSPRFMPAHLNLARLELASNQVESARARLRRLLEIDKNDVRVMYELGLLERSAGNTEAAIDWLRKATNKRPDDAAPGLALVETLSESRLHSVALTAAKEVALRHPDDLSVQAVLGQAYLAAGDAKAARQTFRNMTRIAEFEPASQVRIARFLLAAGFPADAEYNLQKALTARADFEPAMEVRVEAFLAQKQLVAARDALAALRKQYPNNVRATYLEASIALADGNTKDALKGFELAYKAIPSPELAVMLAQLHFRESDRDAARLVLETELKRRDSIDVRLSLTRLYMELADWQAAKTQLELLIQRRPMDAALETQMANVWLALKDVPRAVAAADRAVRLAPQDPSAIDTLGWVLMHDGQFDDALRRLRDARLRAPQNLEIRYHLAETLHRMGRNDEARAELGPAVAGPASFVGREAALRLSAKLK